jgi:hypothetical protein
MIKLEKNINPICRVRKLRDLSYGEEFILDKHLPTQYIKTASDDTVAIIKEVLKGDKSTYSLDAEVYIITVQSTFAEIDIGTVFTHLDFCDTSHWVKVTADLGYNIAKKYSRSFLDIANVRIDGTLEHR